MAPQDEDDLKLEDVERRREVRGIFPGLKVHLGPPHESDFEAVEASRRGFFVRCEDPDLFALAEVHEAEITLGAETVRCRLQVIRKEIEPRRGVALRIQFIDPRNEELLKKILGPAG